MNVEGLSQALFTQQVSSRVRIRTLWCVAKSLVLTSASHLSSTDAGVLYVVLKNTDQALEQYRDYILILNTG